MVCTVLDFLQMYVMAALAPHHIMLSGGWGCVHKALWITDTLCSVGADLALTSFLTLSSSFTLLYFIFCKTGKDCASSLC